VTEEDMEVQEKTVTILLWYEFLLKKKKCTTFGVGG